MISRSISPTSIDLVRPEFERHTVVISQPMLFPWVGMLEQARLADTFVHYEDVQFSKGSFTNRVQIKTAQGATWLTVPLECVRHGSQIADIRVNDSTRFREKHLRTLQQSYARAPHCAAMMSVVEGVYRTRSPWLSDLAIASSEALWDVFDIRPTLVLSSSSLGIGGGSSQRVLHICEALGATHYVSGHGGRNYLDHESFAERGISIGYMKYEMLEFAQQHGEFTPFVSALDLLANVGPQGRTVIASAASQWAPQPTH